MVGVLVFYSDDPSSHPAEAYSFFCKLLIEKNENQQKISKIDPVQMNARVIWVRQGGRPGAPVEDSSVPSILQC